MTRAEQRLDDALAKRKVAQAHFFTVNKVAVTAMRKRDQAFDAWGAANGEVWTAKDDLERENTDDTV